MLSKFKRDFYKDILDGIRHSSVTFILGPRKCGKTYAMLQMQEENADAEYIDAKASPYTEDAATELLRRILTSIKNNQNKVYLIDEITYFESPERFLSHLYKVCNYSPMTNTRVVVTGSQSPALNFWEGKYFCGCCGIVKADFMNYAEWMSFKNYETPTEENYLEFLCTSPAFYEFGDMRHYLEGCITETIQTNEKAYSTIRNNSVDNLNADILFDIMFCALVNIHIGAPYSEFIGKQQIDNHFPDIAEEMKNKIITLAEGHYQNLHSLSRQTLKEALVFLYRHELISFTWQDTTCRHPYIATDIRSDNFPEFTRDDDGKFVNYNDELFSSLCVYIKHPMLYVALLQSVFGKNMPSDIPEVLLENIVECHVRSLLPESGQYIFRNSAEDYEINYVSVDGFAVEITVSDNFVTHFDSLPEGYKYILLSKTKEEKSDNFMRIPYYKYIHHLSSLKSPMNYDI